MFKAFELKFKAFEYTFKSFEYTFKGYEQRLRCGLTILVDHFLSYL